MTCRPVSLVRGSATDVARRLVVFAGFPRPFCVLTTGLVTFILLGGPHLVSAQEELNLVRCANLVYANGKTSVCFSAEFLSKLRRDTNINTDTKLYPIRLESADLYEYPFAVMTGEGSFALTGAQRDAMKNYLLNGGFIIASAGCSNRSWAQSFRREIGRMFPGVSLDPLDRSHSVFHTVYEIRHLDLGKSSGEAQLEGLEIDGKIVLVFSSDGLNDSGKVSDDCCCCGGNEIKNARLVNANLLAYTLTH